MATLLSNNLAAQNLFHLLPPVPPGWELQREDRIYTPESLYDYINGGAELYLSYGMKEVASRIIVRDENEIRIEIFDMIESRNAFGVFTNTRLTNEKQYGQGSQYFTGAQIFWKNKYYIAITANDENESIINAIKLLATSFDNSITQTGKIPEIIHMLPTENLQADGYLYFHHYIWLNAQFYIANDNFLNIDNTTHAVLAKYNDKENRMYLLLIQYANLDIAGKSHLEFRDRFLHDTKDNLVQIEDKTWIGGELMDNILICVFNGKTAMDVNALIQKINILP